jgi:hypothetical protein
MPDDRVQVIETDAPTNDANICMKGEYEVASKLAPSYANIANNAYQTPAGNEYTVCMPPNLLQLKEKYFVILNVPKLVRVIVVPLEIPVGRGCDNKMYRTVLQEGKIPRIAVN